MTQKVLVIQRLIIQAQRAQREGRENQKDRKNQTGSGIQKTGAVEQPEGEQSLQPKNKKNTGVHEQPPELEQTENPGGAAAGFPEESIKKPARAQNPDQNLQIILIIFLFPKNLILFWIL